MTRRDVKGRFAAVTPPATSIGCRVKSGWALAVLLAGPASAPRVLDRRRIALSDPAVPETIQPYHAALGTGQTDLRAVRRLTRIVERCAGQSFAGLIRAYRAMGFRPRRLGLVVGSTVDPATIGNQHIRAHAHEGLLFRSVLEQAAARHRIRATVFRERDLYAVAADILGGTAAALRLRVAALGELIDGPWRAEEKAAAAVAWLGLKTSPAVQRGT
jgi:hypothetical protein